MANQKNDLPEIPAESKKMIIQAAANLSGKPPESLDLEQALDILGGDNPNPIVNGFINKRAEQTVDAFLENMTDEQLEQLRGAAESGELQGELVTMIQDMTTLVNEFLDNPGEDQQEAGGDPIKETAADDQESNPEPGRRVVKIDLPEHDPDDLTTQLLQADIKNLPEYDPALDPTSPEFDPERYKLYEEANGKLKAAIAPFVLKYQNQWAETLKKSVAASIPKGVGLPAGADLSKAIGAAAGLNAINDVLASAGQAIKKIIPQTFAGLNAFKQSESFQRLLKTLIELKTAADVTTELDELEPYLTPELKKPEYEGRTLEALFDEWTESENPDETLFWKALTAARAAKEEAEGKRVTAKRADTVEYPLDKPNAIIWKLLEKDTAGQISFNMAKYGSKQHIPAYYAIDFDALGNDITITKRLLPFDKRVYIAISALFNAGNKVISLSQIYYTMGYTGRPGTNNLTKINDAITKMTAARIFFDNKQEADAYKYNRFRYDGSLLPLERGAAIINGQLADAAIHIFREPPLITFAKQRKQITTVDIKLLQSPISKTNDNLLIDDYLIERISKAKNGKGHRCRILFKTLYEHANVKTKKQIQRAPDKVKKYLAHYQSESFITRFTMEKDGVTIYW